MKFEIPGYGKVSEDVYELYLRDLPNEAPATAMPALDFELKETKPKAKRNDHEHEEQVKLFQWAAANIGKYPELEYLYAVPNGGHRHKAVAGRLKAEGARAGVPDVALPVRRGRYSGLHIEMKWGKNKTTTEQNKWLTFLATQGRWVAVCYSFEDAQKLIIHYLELK